jgi:hypothetical protein
MSVDLRHMRPQIAEAEEFLRFMFSPGDLVEIRGLSKGGGPVMGGLFNDFNLAARTAALLSSNGANVYYTLNPVNPESDYARRRAQTNQINMLLKCLKVTAADKDILHRNLYLFDADPERGVKGTCSSDAEKAGALEVAKTLEAHLRSLGFPDPVWVDSGNGYHLLYKADGPTKDPRLKVAIRALAGQFSTASAKIDRVVYNDARIARLPGFRNRKGPDTPDRPHRLAKVISIPTLLETTPADLLQAVLGDDNVAEAPRDPVGQVGSTHTNAVTDRNPVHRRPTTGNVLLDIDGVKQLAREFPKILSICKVTEDRDSLYFALDPCPFKGSAHTDQHVGMGKSCIILSRERIGFKCFSDDCDHHTFADLLRLLHHRTGRRFSRRVWAEPNLDNTAKRRSCDFENTEHTNSLVEEQSERATVKDLFVKTSSQVSCLI